MQASDATTLRSWVQKFEGCVVGVLGDLVTDEFIYGDINRVSREAPVLILDEMRRVIVPGGAANSVANLRALGARPKPVGIVGQDEAGRALLAKLRESSISTASIFRSADYATPAKSRVLAGGVHTRRQQVVRIDRGQPRGELSTKSGRELDRRLATALKGCQGLLIADYGYGAASPTSKLIRRIERLRRKGLPVTVDSRERVTQFRGVSICSPNQEELEGALGAGPIADAEIDVAAKRLLRRTGNDAILVTRGAQGMSLAQPRKAVQSIPAWGSDEVADVTGAGDTVIATLTLALIAGAPWIDAARLANYAAGIVVTKMGTATVTPDELIEAINEDHRS